ncbi:hypothetical protein ACHAWF_011356 [Thalassiosira exigua]
MAPKRKLTGAQARLFARICVHYMDAVEAGCNDTPAAVPIFSQLGKAQRLKLVSEVMIGVLCEDEPLPPDTIQHNATYRALIHILFTELEVESDRQYDFEDVGEDLLNFDTEERQSQPRTSHEMEELELKRDLVEHRAEKNMKRMKRKDVGDFHTEETKPTEAQMDVLCNRLNKIFSGGPVSAEERNSIRPLNEGEQAAFEWRRLCDAALQEDSIVEPPFHLTSLTMVNFDWRCQKLRKWYIALNLLMDTKMMDYGSPTNHALIHRAVEKKSYADPEQLPRIQAIERHVDILKKVFEPTWDPKLLALDQRCIFAICSTEIYSGEHHKEWLIGFLVECQAHGIDFTEDGNYQKRLDIFRKTKNDFIDGCGFPFGCPHDNCKDFAGHDCCWGWAPGDAKAVGFFEEKRCHGPGNPDGKFPWVDMCFVTENLMSCSVCNTVKYCSAECQRLDWPNHKKICPRLAAQRKDKDKIAEMAKSI